MASGRKKQGWFKRVKEFVGSPYIGRELETQLSVVPRWK